jgi:hypothetical protein
MAYNAATRTFDLFADMRLQNGTTNVKVFVLGGTSINDGNQGDFYWNGSSTVADDNLNTIKAIAATGRYIRLATPDSSNWSYNNTFAS